MSDDKVVNDDHVLDAESIDRDGNSASDEMAGVTEVSFERVDPPDPQDNIHTKDQILALLADGAPSWMSDEKYPFLAGRTDLYCYKDAVLVAAKNISGLSEEKYAELQSMWSHFGAWDDRNYIALLVCRKQDWKIARELVAKMWNLRDEKAIHDYYDCPCFGFDLEEQWEKAAEAIEHDPDVRCAPSTRIEVADE